MLARGCVLGRTRTWKHFFTFIFTPKVCLLFRPLMGTASFCSTPGLAVAPHQALGHSSITTTSTTSKSAHPQQQHQELECVACSDLAAVAAAVYVSSSYNIQIWLIALVIHTALTGNIIRVCALMLSVSVPNRHYVPIQTGIHYRQMLP